VLNLPKLKQVRELQGWEEGRQPTMGGEEGGGKKNLLVLRGKATRTPWECKKNPDIPETKKTEKKKDAERKEDAPSPSHNQPKDCRFPFCRATDVVKVPTPKLEATSHEREEKSGTKQKDQEEGGTNEGDPSSREKRAGTHMRLGKQRGTHHDHVELHYRKKKGRI